MIESVGLAGTEFAQNAESGPIGPRLPMAALARRSPGSGCTALPSNGYLMLSRLETRRWTATGPVPVSQPVTRQRDGTSGSPRPRDHLAGLREHHGAAGAGSSTGGGAGRWRRR